LAFSFLLTSDTPKETNNKMLDRLCYVLKPKNLEKISPHSRFIGSMSDTFLSLYLWIKYYSEIKYI